MTHFFIVVTKVKLNFKLITGSIISWHFLNDQILKNVQILSIMLHSLINKICLRWISIKPENKN